MPRSRIAQVYGYAVCLIAVVTLLIATSHFVDAAFARSNPLHSQNYRYGPFDASMVSFEAFHATYPGETVARPRTPDQPPQPGDTLSTAELRARYEALRADRIAAVRFNSTKEMVKHGCLLVIAIALFFTHWRWVRTTEVVDSP